jgi:hypothetical protein
MSEVFLKCVKEGSKLRIKIISSGFFNEANCQFPKNIRVEGRKFQFHYMQYLFQKVQIKNFFIESINHI